MSSLAAEQAGVFSRAQAHRAGFSNYRLAGGVAREELVAETPQVFRLASAPRDLAARDWVAWLGAGSGAVMAAWSAARHHGLESPVRCPASRCLRTGTFTGRE